LVRRQLNGRHHGPLFLGNASGARLSRQGASTIVRRTAERARLPYPVSGQMLAYSLPAIALQRGFSYRGVVRAIGIPDRRHSERWLGAAMDPTEDNAAIRLARLVIDPPDTSGSLLAHIEALTNESDLPDAFGVMAAGAVVERHLRLLGSEHGIRAKEDAAKGSEPPRDVWRLWSAPGSAESRFLDSHATVMMRLRSNSIGVSQPSWL
jgi:hypothetical protein